MPIRAKILDSFTIRFFVLKTGEYRWYHKGKSSFYSFRKSYPMILVANKIDLVHLRKVSEEEGRELAAELQIPYIEASAKVPPINVDAAFYELVRAIRRQNPNQTKKKRKNRRYNKRCRLMWNDDHQFDNHNISIDCIFQAEFFSDICLLLMYLALLRLFRQCVPVWLCIWISYQNFLSNLFVFIQGNKRKLITVFSMR